MEACSLTTCANLQLLPLEHVPVVVHALQGFNRAFRA